MKDNLRQRGNAAASTCEESAGSLFQGGCVVPPGTYVGLQDGHIVRMSSQGCLPLSRGFSEYYLRASDYHGELMSRRWSVARW